MSENISWESVSPPAPGWYYTFQHTNRSAGKNVNLTCWRWWNGKWWSSSARPGWGLKAVGDAANKKAAWKGRTLWCYKWPKGEHPNKPKARKFDRVWPDGTPKSMNNAFTQHIFEK